MADDVSKSNFSDILSNLKRKFEITDSKWIDNKLYELKFRTQIAIDYDDYNKYCDRWVDEFSYVTDTIWVHTISNTGPKVKFRKQYQCWPYETKEVNKDLLFDARRCRATLDVKVLGDTTSAKKLKKSNRYLKLGLNALIKITFQHLHPVDISWDFSFFVHWCKPLPEAPSPPAAASNERVSQLVAKVVENATITSQKAAERAREALSKQSLATANFTQKTEAITASPSAEDNSLKQLPAENETSASTEQPPIAPMIVQTSNGLNTANIIYVQQVVFDSATQTLTEVIPASSTILHCLTGQSDVQGETTHISPAPSIHSTNNQIL